MKLRGTNWLNQCLFSIFSRKRMGRGKVRVFFGSHLLKATACCDCREFNKGRTSFTWHSLRRLIVETRHRRQWSTGLSMRWEVWWRRGNRWRDENGPKVCRCMREDDGECVDLLRRLVATGDLRLSLFLRRCCVRDHAEVVMARCLGSTCDDTRN